MSTVVICLSSCLMSHVSCLICVYINSLYLNLLIDVFVNQRDTVGSKLCVPFLTYLITYLEGQNSKNIRIIMEICIFKMSKYFGSDVRTSSNCLLQVSKIIRLSKSLFSLFNSVHYLTCPKDTYTSVFVNTIIRQRKIFMGPPMLSLSRTPICCRVNKHAQKKSDF